VDQFLLVWQFMTPCNTFQMMLQQLQWDLLHQCLLSAGAKGKRYALPHARIMMHQPSGGIGGTASDIKIQAEQMLHIKKQMARLIAEHTGQTADQIEQDSDRDRWFTADDAKVYGFVDKVVRSASDVTGHGGTR
jgi:ATP-dependent Clp protease protease subunit